jgi:tetratricopeptide (TPR) repeat protein
MRTQIFTIIIFLFSAQVIAQNDRATSEQDRKDQELMKRNALLRMMDSAVVYMDQGNYEMAEQRFIYVLQNIKGVPSDLTFYFGKNSFYLNKYKQSLDWINKYVQLKGTTGQHSAEAYEILAKAEAELVKEQTKEAAKAKEILARDYDIDCGPTGKVICPVCKGSTVIISRGAFGNQYRTCQFCDQHGMLTCDEYNLLIRGHLKPRQQ